jgi:nucleotide-binding universal stress UspA family protein
MKKPKPGKPPVPPQPPKPWKIGRILVAIDFSESSMHALSHAASLAAAHGAELTVLHVGEPLHPDWFFDTSRIQAELIEKADSALKDACGKFCEGLKAHTEMRFGHPVETIVETADKMGADVIVIGTHGHTGVKRALLGSVAERVARHAKHPVLVVR